MNNNTSTSVMKTLPKHKAKIDWSKYSLGTAATLVMAFLYGPIWVLVIFSFNDNPVTTLPMRGFTWRWYEAMLANEQMLEAIANSLYVASFSTILAVLIGIPTAFVMDRYTFHGKTLFRRLVLMPITLPGIITGISMLNFFRVMDIGLSLETVIIGHATALVGIVVTQVYARLQRFNRRLEEASSDLGASPWKTFRFITLPNIRSAIIGSSLLTFTLSFDEIPVTFFLTGRDNTLPMYIYSTLRRGITPEINAVGTVIILVSLVLIVSSVILLNPKSESAAKSS